jgi:hypothetical protein
MAGIRRDNGAERAIPDCGVDDIPGGLAGGFAECVAVGVAAGGLSACDDDVGGVAVAVPVSGSCRLRTLRVRIPAPMSSITPTTNHQRLFTRGCLLSAGASVFVIDPPDDEDPLPGEADNGSSTVLGERDYKLPDYYFPGRVVETSVV